MSLLATKTLGIIEIEDKQIINFPDGLYGFQNEKQFAIIHDTKDTPFIWLQSTKNESLAFVILEPEIFCKKVSYIPIVSQSDLEELKVNSLENCKVYVIVTIPANDPNSMTANLQGPILINKEKLIGRQIISMDEKHDVRVSILKSLTE